MNSHDMICSIYDGVLNVIYSSGVIERAEAYDLRDTIQFYFRDGRVMSVNIPKSVELDSVYLKQFGIGITEDGVYFLLQSWRKGLFCFELETGRMVWHYKRKQAYELVVRKAIVICRFFDQCVDAIDIMSGTCVAHYPLGIRTKFIPLNDEYYLVGPKRRKYYLLDNTLSPILCLQDNQLNPNLFDTFIIHSAEFTNDGIIISGFEYAYDAHAFAIRSGCVDEFIEKSRFSRYLKLELYT